MERINGAGENTGNNFNSTAEFLENHPELKAGLSRTVALMSELKDGGTKNADSDVISAIDRHGNDLRGLDELKSEYDDDVSDHEIKTLDQSYNTQEEQEEAAKKLDETKTDISDLDAEITGADGLFKAEAKLRGNEAEKSKKEAESKLYWFDEQHDEGNLSDEEYEAGKKEWGEKLNDAKAVMEEAAAFWSGDVDKDKIDSDTKKKLEGLEIRELDGEDSLEEINAERARVIEDAKKAKAKADENAEKRDTFKKRVTAEGTIKVAEDEIQDAEKKLDGLEMQFLDGNISEDEYNAAKNQLNDDISGFRDEIESAKNVISGNAANVSGEQSGDTAGASGEQGKPAGEQGAAAGEQGKPAGEQGKPAGEQDKNSSETIGERARELASDALINSEVMLWLCMGKDGKIDDEKANRLLDKLSHVYAGILSEGDGNINPGHPEDDDNINPGHPEDDNSINPGHPEDDNSINPGHEEDDDPAHGGNDDIVPGHEENDDPARRERGRLRGRLKRLVAVGLAALTVGGVFGFIGGYNTGKSQENNANSVKKAVESATEKSATEAVADGISNVKKDAAESVTDTVAKPLEAIDAEENNIESIDAESRMNGGLHGGDFTDKSMYEKGADTPTAVRQIIDALKNYQCINPDTAAQTVGMFGDEVNSMDDFNAQAKKFLGDKESAFKWNKKLTDKLDEIEKNGGKISTVTIAQGEDYNSFGDIKQDDGSHKIGVFSVTAPDDIEVLQAIDKDGNNLFNSSDCREFIAKMCGVSADDVEVMGLSGVCGQLIWRVGRQLVVFDKMPQQPTNPEKPKPTKPTETENNGKNDTIVSSEGLGNQYETSEYKGALSEAGEENRKVNNNNPGASVTTDDTWVDYNPGQQSEQGTQTVDETQNQAQDLSDQGSAGQNDLNGAFEAMNRIYDSTSGNGQ